MMVVHLARKIARTITSASLNTRVWLALGLICAGTLVLSLRGNKGEYSPSVIAAELWTNQIEGGSTYYFPIIVSPPLPTVFGFEVHQIKDSLGLQQMAQANVYWVRRNGVFWSKIQPDEGGAYKWEELADLENELLAAKVSGIQVILVVRGTPDWAAVVPGFGCSRIHEIHLPAFVDFMQELVERYSGPPFNVKYWEIWNEPDVDPSLISPRLPFGCWGDEDDDYYGGGYYAEVLKLVYPKIKAADPEAQVLVGGLLLDCNPNDPPPGTGKDCKPSKYLEGILINGGKDFFDGVSFHAYDFFNSTTGFYMNGNWESGWNPTDGGDGRPVLVAKTRFVREVLSIYGASDKFLMNTEVALLCGSVSDDPGGPGCEPDPDSPFELTKAYYVSQVYAAAIAEGLAANIWYDILGWRNSGLLYSDLTPRPAYTAYVVARNTLRDGTFAGLVEEFDTNVNVYEFVLTDRRIWVLWSLDGDSHDITLPQIPLAAWDSLGEPIDAFSGAVTVGKNPYYLEWSPNVVDRQHR